MDTTRMLRRGFWLCAATVLAACNEPAPPRLPATPSLGYGYGPGAGRATPAPEPEPPPREDVATPTSGSVNIDERIIRICGNLPVPHFALDSAAIQGVAADHLRTVARCFTTGPLKGHSLKLVGRADPRGTEMYNLALGQERAASVARFLASAGIPEASIRTMSRGELDATGTDQEGWARDRRVDIVLGD